MYVVMMVKPGWIQTKTNIEICRQDELREAEGLRALSQRLEICVVLTVSLSCFTCPSASPHLLQQTPAQMIDGTVENLF